jgi:hypothetical protein
MSDERYADRTAGINGVIGDRREWTLARKRMQALSRSKAGWLDDETALAASLGLRLERIPCFGKPMAVAIVARDDRRAGTYWLTSRQLTFEDGAEPMAARNIITAIRAVSAKLDGD